MALYRKEAYRHSLLTFPSVLLKIKIIFTASLRRVNTSSEKQYFFSGLASKLNMGFIQRMLIWYVFRP